MFIEDVLRKVWLYATKSKMNSFERFKEFKAIRRNENGTQNQDISFGQ